MHPTSFSHVTSRNVVISPQNFLNFGFNLSMIKFQAAPSASPKLLNLNQDHPSKKWFYWSNLCKIEVIMTSLIEILDQTSIK